MAQIPRFWWGIRNSQIELLRGDSLRMAGKRILPCVGDGYDSTVVVATIE